MQKFKSEQNTYKNTTIMHKYFQISINAFFTYCNFDLVHDDN